MTNRAENLHVLTGHLYMKCLFKFIAHLKLWVIYLGVIHIVSLTLLSVFHLFCGCLWDHRLPTPWPSTWEVDIIWEVLLDTAVCQFQRESSSRGTFSWASLNSVGKSQYLLTDRVHLAFLSVYMRDTVICDSKLSCLRVLLQEAVSDQLTKAVFLSPLLPPALVSGLLLLAFCQIAHSSRLQGVEPVTSPGGCRWQKRQMAPRLEKPRKAFSASRSEASGCCEANATSQRFGH